MKPKPLKGRTWNPYTIPDVINPGAVRCVQVYIPDSLQWLQIFAAVMDTMCHWKNYELLGDTSAGQCAALMRDIMQQYNTFETCEQCPDGQEYNGEELMASLCESLRFHNGKLQSMCCGEWTDIDGQQGLVTGGGSQPGPGGDVPAGTCQTFNLVVQGNGQLLLPVMVDDGYVITISDAQGGWFDGNPLHAWQCPSGFTYALGECVSLGPTDPSSPAPTLPTGRLIAMVGSATLDAYDTVIAVPDGTGPTNVYLQMNDASLADNQGSISVTVKVCQNDAPQNTYGISYNFGSGPATVVDGQVFTITSAPRAEPYGVTDNMEFTISPCVRLEILSQTGWISSDSGGLNWNVLDCASVGHPAYSPTATPLTAFGSQQATVVGINSKAPFIVTFKATAP